MASPAQTDRPYQIRGWDAGDDQFYLSIRVNGYRFSISVALENYINSPKASAELGHVLKKLEAGYDADAEDEEDVWDFSEQIADKYIPQFENLAPPLVHAGKIMLADLASRGSYECEYRVQDEVAVPDEFVLRTTQFSPCPEWDMRSIQPSFPLFSPLDIEIYLSEPTNFDDIIPRKVYVQGQRLYYKACWSPGDALPEVDKYRNLAAHAEVQTSKLFGIVVDQQGQSKGLLYHWINTKLNGTLTAAVNLGAPREKITKWAAQVRDTVLNLHKLGIIWGDAKPDNVLIDKDDNAIVIGLEGGTTRGWVDREVAESMEGDLQGLGRLEEFVLK